MNYKQVWWFRGRRTLVAASFVFVASLAACERDMTVSVINQSNPPSFKLSGSGRLIFFSVFEVPRDRPSSIDDPKMWEIRPVDENLISKLANITYGIVPPGFQQTIPETGTPPLLVEGKLYEAGGPAFDANGGSIRFTIKDSKIVIVSAGP
ncbi:MAG TPA: hypothetical protein VN843_04985 [Anaerolineales bacterium]|nr:hypothetical protein [Anaerolineales bacterium]